MTPLRDFWNIEGALEKISLGVSRATWKVDGGFWLTRCAADRGDAFQREAELIQSIGEVVEAHRALGLITPALIPTTAGEMIGDDIEGVHPRPSDPGTYGVLADILLRLHSAFGIVPENGITAPNYLKSLRHCLLLPAENAISARAAAWLIPRQDRLAALPVRLVNGDWTPLNVLVRSDGSAGVLDFEACARGPAVLDFANICSTMLMWSGLENASCRIKGLVSTFEEKSGISIGLDVIQIAMLAHWFRQYCEWRKRPITAENSEIVRRLLGRIETVLEFVIE